MKIFKYGLDLSVGQRVAMPFGARILEVHGQHGGLFMWALVNPQSRHVERTFDVYGTGHDIERETARSGRFIGTAHCEPFVWHVFETTEEWRK